MSNSEDQYVEHLFSYNYEGDKWLFTIKARDQEDAEGRVKRLQWATYDGEVKAVIHVPGGPLQRFILWLTET